MAKARNAERQKDFSAWAAAIGANAQEVEAAWEDLVRRGLVAMKRGRATISPLALRRATSDAQRRLAAYLSGYLLTENSYIVRRPGDPPSNPYVLNTRIGVEHVANYFLEGWGVTDIQRDLSILTRDEIEAAIHYYLNHRTETEKDMRRSRELYALHSRERELVSA